MVKSKIKIQKKLTEKENKELRNKNLSIYELIKSFIQTDGSLPENFSLPQEKTDGISWADGAMDGVFLYQTDGETPAIPAKISTL